MRAGLGPGPVLFWFMLTVLISRSEGPRGDGCKGLAPRLPLSQWTRQAAGCVGLEQGARCLLAQPGQQATPSPFRSPII